MWKELKLKAERAKREAEFNEKLKLQAIANFLVNYKKAESIFKMLGFEVKLENDKIVVYDLCGNFIGVMTSSLVYGGTMVKLNTIKGELSYITCIDGKSTDGGNISRNIISLNNLKQIGEENGKKKFEGKIVTVELGVGELADSNIPRIEIRIIDPNAENIITEFETNSYSFYANLNNTFGPYGNYIDGTNRSIRYTDISKNPYRGATYFMNHETIWNGDGSYIMLEKKLHDIPFKDDVHLRTLVFKNGQTGVRDFDLPVSYCDVDNIAKYLLKQPRTINLVEYVLNNIDRYLPGIKQYIFDNSILMRSVKNQMHDPSTIDLGEAGSSLKLTHYYIQQCDLTSERKK